VYNDPPQEAGMTDQEKTGSIPRCEFESEKLILHLNLKIPADVKQIDPVVEKILWVVGEMRCAAGKEFELETALREALANAIVHGCKGDPEKEIQFAVACDETKGIMIVVRDPGEGFDPDTLPSPIQGECLYSEHGRGIFLINQLMDEVEFDRGGTEIRMRKN
jgi:serine/threonine-protein kinase RsbW